MDSFDELNVLGQEIFKAFDQLLDRAKDEQPPENAFACQAGCSHCCFQPEITVTAIEVFYLADFINMQFTHEETRCLIKALTNTAKLSPPAQEQVSWALVACPLLQDGACSVYAARPLVCRGMNSYDIDDCERAREQNRQHPTIRNYGSQERVAHLTIEALKKGMVDAGREAYLLNLAPALLIALRDPEAKKNWLNRQQVFSTARAKSGT